MPFEWFIHASGLGALALNIAALVHPCERRLRIRSSLAGAAWALNNLLLGAHTAAALSLVSAGRTATAAVTLSASERRRRLAFVAFAVVTLVVGLLTWHGWPSALIIAASLISTHAMFHLRGVRLRLALIVSSALWMHSAWYHDSWEQMAANLLSAGAALVGMWQIERAERRALSPGR
jgi:hypothetical protein